MIVRFIVFVLIFTLLWFLFKRIRSFIDQRTRQVNQHDQKKNQNTPEAEPMVVCKKCGVYTPRNHAIKANETDFYCSKEHYLADKSRK